MKLLIAIVQDQDSSRLVDALMEKGFSVTKLATTGGFLRSGNTTLLLGLEDQLLDSAIGTIESICKTRKQITAATPSVAGVPGSYSAFPIEVTVGGATLFVVDVEQFRKI